MRKTTLTAAVLTALLLGGCGAPPPGGASDPQGAASASRLPSSAAETVRFELDSDRRSDSVSADDGTLLASYTYTIPVLRAVTALGEDTEGFQAAVTEELIRQADRRAMDEDCAPTEMYWENYRDILSRWPDYAVTFSDSGMTVSYPAYELAAYALGPQVFELDLDFLEPYLSADGRELLGLPPV